MQCAEALPCDSDIVSYCLSRSNLWLFNCKASSFVFVQTKVTLCTSHRFWQRHTVAGRLSCVCLWIGTTFFFFRVSPAVTIAGSHANVQSVRKCPATTSLHFSPNSNLPTGANGCSWNTITANTQNVCLKCALKKHPWWILNNANLLLDVSSYLPYTHTPLVTNTWLGMYLYTWCSHKLSRRTCRLQIGFWRKQRKEAEFPMWLQ